MTPTMLTQVVQAAERGESVSMPASEVLRIWEAARYMLRLVEMVYGTDNDSADPDDLNSAGVWHAEAEYRRHRDVIMCPVEDPTR